MACTPLTHTVLALLLLWLGVVDWDFGKEEQGRGGRLGGGVRQQEGRNFHAAKL